MKNKRLGETLKGKQNEREKRSGDSRETVRKEERKKVRKLKNRIATENESGTGV